MDFSLLCTLAGVRVPPSEQERVQARVQAVLAYVEQLQQVDVGTSRAVPITVSDDALRADHAHEAAISTRSTITSQFIRCAGEQLLVPAVLGRDT